MAAAYIGLFLATFSPVASLLRFSSQRKSIGAPERDSQGSEIDFWFSETHRRPL